MFSCGLNTPLKLDQTECTVDIMFIIWRLKYEALHFLQYEKFDIPAKSPTTCFQNPFQPHFPTSPIMHLTSPNILYLLFFPFYFI